MKTSLTTAKAVAFKILSAQERADKDSFRLPVGRMESDSFTLSFTHAGVEVAPAQTYVPTVGIAPTVAVPAMASAMDEVVGILLAACEQELAAAMGGAHAAKRAATVLQRAMARAAGEGATSAQDVVLETLRRSARVTDDGSSAWKARWDAEFKGTVGTRTRAGSTKVARATVGIPYVVTK